MILKFYAVSSALVAVPGPRAVGQAPRYVGREFKAPADGKPAAYPATKEPYEVESDSEDGRRMVHVCSRDATLYPADKATADACGVKLPDVSFVDGAWSAKPVTATKKESSTNG